jgi:hypothetical protein
VPLRAIGQEVRCGTEGNALQLACATRDRGSPAAVRPAPLPAGPRPRVELLQDVQGRGGPAAQIWDERPTQWDERRRAARPSSPIAARGPTCCGHSTAACAALTATASRLRPRVAQLFIWAPAQGTEWQLLRHDGVWVLLRRPPRPAFAFSSTHSSDAGRRPFGGGKPRRSFLLRRVHVSLLVLSTERFGPAPRSQVSPLRSQSWEPRAGAVVAEWQTSVSADRADPR